MLILRNLILVAFISINALAIDKVYFLPKESLQVKQDIINLIDNAKEKIDIAMYNISYKKFHKALKKASKRGVKITIIYQKSKLDLYKNFKLIKTERKQHIKLAIIDNKVVIFGSANWKKTSFNKNYEIINIIDDKIKVARFAQIFKELKEKN
jgi:phosphatidylserine/phosphatidylglycerophosphate/cardiolipin synthase-like enzyme